MHIRHHQPSVQSTLSPLHFIVKEGSGRCGVHDPVLPAKGSLHTRRNMQNRQVTTLFARCGHSIAAEQRCQLALLAAWAPLAPLQTGLGELAGTQQCAEAWGTAVSSACACKRQRLPGRSAIALSRAVNAACGYRAAGAWATATYLVLVPRILVWQVCAVLERSLAVCFELFTAACARGHS